MAESRVPPSTSPRAFGYALVSRRLTKPVVLRDRETRVSDVLRCSFVLCSALVTGCATRAPMKTYPPRPPGCEIELIAASGSVAPGWTIIGTLSGSIPSERIDPLSREAVDHVRARVCGMGGEAISFVSRRDGKVLTDSPSMTVTIGPGATYDVWRRSGES